MQETMNPTDTWTAGSICDFLIAIAYFSIPIQLAWMLARYPIPIQKKYVVVGCLFTAFICLCGTTHLFHCFNASDAILLTSKALTAIVSLATAAVLIKVVPEILKVPIYTIKLEEDLSDKLTELKYATGAAEHANAQSKDFMSFLCHELRNPLHNIVSNIDFMLEDKSLTQQQNEYLSSINASSELMSNIINDVLDINALQSGKLVFERRAINLYDLCNSVIAQSKSRAYAKGLGLECNIDSAVPQFVFSDPTRLFQILINLISNSIKFSARGSVVLDVNVDNDNTSNQHLTGTQRSLLRISVTDNGIGISAEMKEKLFQPYSQAKLAVVRSQAGTGLGLSIVFAIVKLLNGTIDVESTEGVGSQFIIHVALDHATQRDFEATKRQSMSVAAATSSDRAQHILVADDNSVNRKLMSKILQSLNITCDTAVDGLDALDKVRNNPTKYAAILMDIHMPNMDGYASTMEIRKLGYQGKIVALTANVLSGEKDKSKAAGMNHFLAKPIRKQELCTVLMKLLPHWHIGMPIDEKKTLSRFNSPGMTRRHIQPDLLGIGSVDTICAPSSRHVSYDKPYVLHSSESPPQNGSAVQSPLPTHNGVRSLHDSANLPSLNGNLPQLNGKDTRESYNNTQHIIDLDTLALQPVHTNGAAPQMNMNPTSEYLLSMLDNNLQQHMHSVHHTYSLID